VSWALAGLALLLLGGRRRLPGRHRPAAALPGSRLPVFALVAAGCLVPALGGQVGLVLAVPAAVAAALLGSRVGQSRPAPLDRSAVAFLLDLLAAVLRTGAPLDQAIEAVGQAVQRRGTVAFRDAAEPLRVVGRLLRLGAEPERAWSVVAQLPGLEPVAAAGRRCADSGARLAGALTETAEQLRAEQLHRALARGQRAGVWALLPLGCCFLPAFVCLGVVPVVVGTAGQVLPG